MSGYTRPVFGWGPISQKWENSRKMLNIPLKQLFIGFNLLILPKFHRNAQIFSRNLRRRECGEINNSFLKRPPSYGVIPSKISLIRGMQWGALGLYGGHLAPILSQSPWMRYNFRRRIRWKFEKDMKFYRKNEDHSWSDYIVWILPNYKLKVLTNINFVCYFVLYFTNFPKSDMFWQFSERIWLNMAHF